MARKGDSQVDPTGTRHSFVVRIWREESNPGWRGWVQHTQTQESATISDLEALLAFMEQRAGKLTGAAHKDLTCTRSRGRIQ